jgi:hypothetical protein
LISGGGGNKEANGELSGKDCPRGHMGGGVSEGSWEKMGTATCKGGTTSGRGGVNTGGVMAAVPATGEAVTVSAEEEEEDEEECPMKRLIPFD